jgi:hypothetical protein
MSKDFGIDQAKSYATEANLVTALTRKGWHDHRHVVVRNRAGRFTAVFPASNLTGPSGGGYLALYSSEGFLTLG